MRSGIALSSILLAGCLSPERAERAIESEGSSESTAGPIESTGEDELVDRDAVVERAFGYATEFVKLNQMPAPGTHGDAATINYWSAPANLELFKTIDPELENQEVSFIEGAMFVKEHFNPDGEVIGFTAMFKGPPGYNPEGGDWFWARVNNGNVSHQGNVKFCVNCHVKVDNTDYVYGVPLDNRSQ